MNKVVFAPNNSALGKLGVHARAGEKNAGYDSIAALFIQYSKLIGRSFAEEPFRTSEDSRRYFIGKDGIKHDQLADIGASGVPDRINDQNVALEIKVDYNSKSSLSRKNDDLRDFAENRTILYNLEYTMEFNNLSGKGTSEQAVNHFIKESRKFWQR